MAFIGKKISLVDSRILPVTREEPPWGRIHMFFLADELLLRLIRYPHCISLLSQEGPQFAIPIWDSLYIELRVNFGKFSLIFLAAFENIFFRTELALMGILPLAVVLPKHIIEACYCICFSSHSSPQYRQQDDQVVHSHGLIFLIMHRWWEYWRNICCQNRS